MGVRGVWASYHDSVGRCRSLRRTNYLQSEETIQNSQNLLHTMLPLHHSRYLQPPPSSINHKGQRTVTWAPNGDTWSPGQRGTPGGLAGPGDDSEGDSHVPLLLPFLSVTRDRIKRYASAVLK